MNRTIAFLVAACALGLVALLMKAPVASVPSPAPVPPPAPVVQPTPPPPPALPPPEVVTKPGSLTLNGKLSHPYVVPGSSDVFATLEVSAVDVPGARRAPLEQLDERDSLAIVHYGSDVKGMPSRKVTPENREAMRRYIERIIDDGG